MAQAILGMVEGLAARLDSQGGSVDDWMRLIRSYTVLGDMAKAKASERKARRGSCARINPACGADRCDGP